MTFLPNDILIRTTSDGQTVWVSQRVVCELCGVQAKDLKDTHRVRYKASLSPSWRKVAEQKEFFLGDRPGRSWRWGRKGGQYYYDYDRIPNRRPGCCRDRLPAKEALIAAVEGRSLLASRERQAEQRRMVLAEVQAGVDHADILYYEEYAFDGKRLFTPAKARQLALSAAWCRFLKHMLADAGYKTLGFTTQAGFLTLCAELIARSAPEGLRVKSAEYLRRKMAVMPDDPALLREWLVSGKYGNDHRRIIGKSELVDYTTGEVFQTDLHETAIMTCWLNPGGADKGTKKELWEHYAADMEALGLTPVKPSTFNHYTNAWTRKLLAAKERHGRKHFSDTYRPYVPARHLEFANSLWASDGSGVVPYRYRDRQGKWRMMKLYVMLVSDVASRYIAGFAVSRRGSHLEDGAMLRQAMRMALLDNGRTEVLDFISDNHGAYTSAPSREYLQLACRSVRTIAPGNSQANPAEMMFRLFKRRFKRFFLLPETSWNARSLESLANPDHYDLMALPTYEQAAERLAAAVGEWNNTKLQNGLTPAEWFHTLKNKQAGSYSDRHYRRITGEVSHRDLSCARSILELERSGQKYRFDIPSDPESIALIARHMGYAPSFTATVCWNAEGADLYTPAGIYLFTCPPAPLAAKSMSEATDESLAALAYHIRKGRELEQWADNYVAQLGEARAAMLRNKEARAEMQAGDELSGAEWEAQTENEPSGAEWEAEAENEPSGSPCAGKSEALCSPAFPPSPAEAEAGEGSVWCGPELPSAEWEAQTENEPSGAEWEAQTGETALRSYDFHIRDAAAKEDYNALRERISASGPEQRAQRRACKKEREAHDREAFLYRKNQITDLSKYT